jgi:hypothetical protein
MISSLAHIAWRPALGAVLALAVVGVVDTGTMQASAADPAGATPTVHTIERERTAPQVVPAPSVARAAAASSRSRYGWPVKPFRAQHPVRGFFGDPRISNHGQTRQFHFGVDVSAPNGTPVYATLTGRIWIHPLHPNTIGIVGGDGVEFSYWHVIPVVRTGERAVAYRTLIGRIEAPYAHVHFSEARKGRYLNPLRPGAMGPFVDDTDPEVTSVLVEREGRQLQSSGVRGAFDLFAEVRDETPLAIPRPWHDLPVTPALVRWRVVGANRRAVLGWQNAADFRETIPPASDFDRVWAPGTTQNHVRAPGRYRIYLAQGLDGLRAGSYTVEVVARDLGGNSASTRFSIVVRD